MRWLPPTLALLRTLPALRPLWQPGLQQTDDGMHHLFRLFNLAIRAGYLGARWLALRRPEADYRVFFHLIDHTGALWGAA